MCAAAARSEPEFFSGLDAGVPLIEAADYLRSRFILHLVEGGHQLVARIVVAIAGRFPEGAAGEGDRGG
jgi:hypothetical protein